MTSENPLNILILRNYEWLKGEVFCRLLKNTGILLYGNVGSSVLRLISLSIVTRALSPREFGTLVLIETYAAVFNLIFNFQSWQALIKYGSVHLESRNSSEFRRLIKFGMLLDAGSAFLATIFALGFAFGIGKFLGWTNSIIHYLMLYSLVILFHITGMPTAVLRIFNRFHFFSIRTILIAFVKLVSVSVAYFYDAEFVIFLLIWLFTGILQDIFLLAVGWRVLHTNGYGRILHVPLAKIGKSNPGIWQFVFATNLNGSLVNLAKRIDKFIIASILSIEAVAYYRIVQSLNRFIAGLSDPLYVSVYPELTKLVSKNNEFALRELLKRTSVFISYIASGFYIIFIIGADWLIQFIFGHSYDGVAIVFLIYIFGTLISFIFYYAHPLLLAYGKATIALRINVISVIIYLSALYLLTWYFGLVGAAVSFSCFMLMSVFLRLFYIQKKYKVFSHEMIEN